MQSNTLLQEPQQQSPLESLPIELIERVVLLLDVVEVGMLRLTSRELQSKASQGSYLSRFTRRNVDLTSTGLKSLIEILKEDNLSRKLRQLTIVGVIYDPQHLDGSKLPFEQSQWEPLSLAAGIKEPCITKNKKSGHHESNAGSRKRLAQLLLRKAENEYNIETGVYVDLLTEALASIRSHCGTLDKLRLTLTVQIAVDQRLNLENIDHKSAANYASHLFAITMVTLATSALPVTHLDIFSTTSMCALPCTQLAAFLARLSPNSLNSFTASVRTLAITFSRMSASENRSISSICCNCNTRKFRKPNTDSICHKHSHTFPDEDRTQCSFELSLATFLAKFPNLSNLELHQYETSYVAENLDSNPLLTQIATSNSLHHLHTCVLKGLNLEPTSLQTFLRSCPNLTTLTLNHINITEGSRWAPVLSYLRKSPPPKLQTLILQDLFENKQIDSVPMPMAGNLQNQAHLGNHHAAITMGLPPPPPPALNVDTYLNTLMSFRLENTPEKGLVEEGAVVLDGLFSTNKLTLKSEWIRKVEVGYGFVGHAGSRYKIERKWDRERAREYGPPLDQIWAF